MTFSEITIIYFCRIEGKYIIWISGNSTQFCSSYARVVLICCMRMLSGFSKLIEIYGKRK